MKKLLIVEDDDSLRDIYKLILENAKYRVDLAADGVSAIKKIKSIRYNLVLLDLMMPDVDGVDVLKEIRVHEWGKYVKVVVMTNMGSGRDELGLDNYGVSDVVLKVDLLPDDLVALVQKHV